jgi:hypothetical protein
MILATHGRALDPRSPRADPGIRQGGRDRRHPLHAAALCDVPSAGARPQLRVLRRSNLLRREPAGAAILSWLNKTGRQVKLRSPTRRNEVRGSRTPLANSNKAGIDRRWDLRVQPNPAPPPAKARRTRRAGRAGEAGNQGGGRIGRSRRASCDEPSAPAARLRTPGGRRHLAAA